MAASPTHRSALSPLLASPVAPLRLCAQLTAIALRRVLLRSRGPGLEQFVVIQLVTLLARTVKLGWFDNDAQRNIVDDCKRLLDSGSPAHYLLGLRWAP